MNMNNVKELTFKELYKNETVKVICKAIALYKIEMLLLRDECLDLNKRKEFGIKYEKEIKALKSRRGASAEQSATKGNSIANSTANLMRGLGEAVNKMRVNSLQAVMADSLEGVRLQTRSNYQNIMQQETKKQSSLLGQMLRATTLSRRPTAPPPATP